MFRAGKYFSPARLEKECAAFSDPKLSAFCAEVGAAGMYGMGKETASYTKLASLAQFVRT